MPPMAIKVFLGPPESSQRLKNREKTRPWNISDFQKISNDLPDKIFRAEELGPEETAFRSRRTHF